MNSRHLSPMTLRAQNRRRALAWLLLPAILFLTGPNPRGQQQQQGVCALVKIVILQELTLERIGFEATLEITDNDGQDPITDFGAELTFENPSLSTADAVNDASSLFFVRAPRVENITDVNGNGVIQPTRKANVRWFIIPKILAGGPNPAGIRYRVGARLSGKFKGVEIPADVLRVVPDMITVKPEPQLEITYFQPRDVQGDDPFTPEVESPIPFTLGVLVKNSGFGRARSVVIKSQQPKIVENRSQLLLVAQLLGARVMDSPLRQADLVVNIGDLNPGETRKGAWDMITSLSGEFVEFKASYTHASDLGGEETSVIKSLQAHFIVHEVLNDQPDRDALKDFLADTDRDANLLPDALYESEGNILPVNYLATAQTENYQGRSFQVKLTADRAGWGYLRLSDPGQAKLRLERVVRSDGKVLNPNNYWTNTRYAKGSNSRSDYLNLFDLVALGDYQYTVTYAPTLLDTNPPVTSLRFVGEVAEAGGKFYIQPETQMYFLSEDLSPVSIYYRVTNSAFMPAYPFWLPWPGEYPIEYYAEDTSGNRESAHRAVLVVGMQAPVLAQWEVPDQPVVIGGEALSVRPDSAIMTFQAGPNPTRMDAQMDVFQGVVAWATVAGAPSSPTRGRGANLAVGGDLVDYYSFSLDGGAWSQEQPVGLRLALTNLADGLHTIRVLGRSRYGEYLAADHAVEAQWTVNSAAPSTTITGAPATPTRDSAATLHIGGQDLTLYRWTLNHGYYRAETAAANPLVFTNLTGSNQVLSVIGKMGGVWQPTNAATEVSWRIDPNYGWDLSMLPLVRTLLRTNIGVQPQTCAWDGRNEVGTLMPPGYYTARLTLRDQVGRRSFAVRVLQLDDVVGQITPMVASDRGPQNPHSRKRWIVWQDQSAGHWEIYASDLGATEPSIFRLTTTELNQENPRTDGRYVVWQARQVNGNWDVWIKDLQSLAAPRALTSTLGEDEVNPVVDWPWVAYQSKTSQPGAPWLLRAINLDSGQALVVSPSTQDQLDPDLQAGRVVWQDWRDVGPGEIYLKNLETGQEQRLTTNAFGQYHPAVYDQWVVWQDNRDGQVDLFGFDLRRGREARLTHTRENETRPYLEGAWCVCEEDSLGPATGNVKLVHLPSLRSVPLTRTASMKSRPSLAANQVIWQEAQARGNQILSARLPVLQAVFANHNAVVVTEGLVAHQPSAHGLLRLWHAQAGVEEITRFRALVPAVESETVRWVTGQPTGPDFALEAGSFLWVRFGGSEVLELGGDVAGPPALKPGVNVLSYGQFPAPYSAFQLLRQLGLDKARAVRMLDAESGFWRVAEVIEGQLLGQDFAIPTAAAVLIEMNKGVAQWLP